MVKKLDLTRLEREKMFLHGSEDVSHIKNHDKFYKIQNLNKTIEYQGPIMENLQKAFERNFDTGYIVKHGDEELLKVLYHPVENRHVLPEDYIVAYIIQTNSDEVVYHGQHKHEFLEFIDHHKISSDDYILYRINLHGQAIPYSKVNIGPKIAQ